MASGLVNADALRSVIDNAHGNAAELAESLVRASLLTPFQVEALREGRGDLLLTPTLRLPQALSEQERQLLEQLRQVRSADPREGWAAAARL